jgi:hypothetical protein
MIRTPVRPRVGPIVAVALAVAGCPRRSEPKPDASASASSASAVPAPIASGVPLDPKEVSGAVNPDGKAAYAGPVGTVEGRIVATGDAPIDLPDVASEIDDKCEKARPFYAKLFREGEGRALADVLVAVTGYHEYIPAKEAAQRFVAKDCTFETRTVALTFGQRLEVVSGDRNSYVPELVGQRGHAQIVATPGGHVASTLYPTRPGRFLLVDNLRLFMTAEVLVLKYATVAVTKLDGRYRITGLPPGDFKLNALLPATAGTVERAVKIEAGKTLTVDLEIPFDEKAYRSARAAQERPDGGALDAGAVRSARPKPTSAPKSPAKP